MAAAILGLLLMLGVTSSSADILSRNKHTEQSSTDWNGASRLAVDGNTDQVYFRGRSCSHTGFENNPWWLVDLGSIKRITHIVIFNRADCCGSRLADFDIKYSNSRDSKYWQICRHYRGAAVDGQILSLPCEANARYVIIQLRRRNYLTLCEVEVHGQNRYHETTVIQEPSVTHVLLSLNRPTEQSSIDWHGPPRLAVDGNTDQYYFRGRSCSHTKYEHRPWWLVDLGSKKRITHVVIYNRADCCGERLADFDVKFSDSRHQSEWQVCRHYSGEAVSGQVLNLPCDAVARYVIIQLRRSNYLTLCEVQVFGKGFFHSHEVPVDVQQPIIQTPLTGVPQPVVRVPHSRPLYSNQPYVHKPIATPHADPPSKPSEDAGPDPDVQQPGAQPLTTDNVLGGDSLANAPREPFDLMILSQGKPAFQSSLAFDGLPGRAVDGNTNQQWSGLSCSHTSYESQPWWRVDLGQEREIHAVRLYNRRDCCGERLANFDIKVSSHLHGPWTVCNYFSGSLTSGQIVDLACHGIARHVVIQLRGTNFLTLCEVHVIGLDITDDKKKKKK